MSDTRNCSFCGRGESETAELLPGFSKGYICLDCIEQNSLTKANTLVPACDFCGRQQADAPKMFAGKDAGICSICLEVISPPVVLMRSGFVINPKTRFGNWLLTTENRFIKKYIVGG